MLLAFVDRNLQHFAFGAEPKAVIDQLGVAWHEAVFQMAGSAIKRDLLNAAMCLEQNSATRRFVYAAGLHSNETIFYEIEPANTMFSANLVKLR